MLPRFCLEISNAKPGGGGGALILGKPCNEDLILLVKTSNEFCSVLRGALKSKMPMLDLNKKFP